MEPLYRTLSDHDIAEVASGYLNRRAFKLGDQSAYQAARKRGTLDAVCAHMKTLRRSQTDEQLAEIASRYATRSEFVANDNGAYQVATKRGILDTVCAHMPDGDRRLSDDELLSIARQHKTRNDLSIADFGVYTTVLRRGLMDQAFAHMEPGATGFREDLPAVLYQFRITTKAGVVVYKVGITNRKPKQRLITMGVQRGAKSELIAAVQFPLGRDARIEEKRLHRLFSASRYDGPAIMVNGNTELFTVKLLDTLGEHHGQSNLQAAERC